MNTKKPDSSTIEERLHDEMIETVDEELELEIDDDRLSNLLALGRGLRRQRLRGRFCLEVSTACHDTGGQAADGGAVGTTSVTAAATTYARRCPRLP